MKKYIILTDSSTGYTEEQAKEHNIAFVPLTITIDGKTIDDDNKIISNHEFYELLKDENKTIMTSQTPPGVLEEKYSALLKEYERVIFFPLSSHLSGQYQTALMLAKNEKFKNKVLVVNSESVSDVAKEMIARSQEFLKKNKIEELPEFVEQLKKKYCAFIIPNNLKRLVIGGRISPAAATLAGLLKIKPILEFKGNIDRFDKTRTFKKALKEALKEIKKRFKNQNGSLILVHSICDETLKELTLQTISKEKFTIKQISYLPNVIAAHTGYDTVVLIYWEN